MTQLRSANDPQSDHYFAACRHRVPAFVASNYGWPGAISLNRQAWGTDILIAPVNFLMGFPNFLLRILALLLELMRAHRAARWLVRRHLGFQTKVQRTLTIRIMGDLLALPTNLGEDSDPLLRRIAAAAKEPIAIYVQTRNVAADITAGTIAAVVGLVVFSQFTPGSISAGAALARAVAREQAISDFWLGDTVGQMFYAIVPVQPPLTVIVATLVVVMATIAIVSAFAGFVHDPMQAQFGIHRRRLIHLLAAIEAATRPTPSRPTDQKTSFLGESTISSTG